MHKIETTLYLSDKVYAKIERLAKDWYVDTETAADMVVKRALYAHVLRNIADYQRALIKREEKGT